MINRCSHLNVLPSFVFQGVKKSRYPFPLLCSNYSTLKLKQFSIRKIILQKSTRLFSEVIFSTNKENSLCLSDIEGLQELSLLEYTSKKVLQHYSNVINGIVGKEEKTQFLQTILKTGHWHDNRLDEQLKNEKFYTEFGYWNYETPFIALYALLNKKISEDQFFQTLMYFSLRLSFPKEDIEIVKPKYLCSDKEDPCKWETVLKLAVGTKDPFRNIRVMSEGEFDHYKSRLELECENDWGRLVFFSFPDFPIVYVKDRPINLTIWNRIYETSFYLFRYQKQNLFSENFNVIGSLIIAQKALEIFFPGSYVLLKPKVGLSPIEAQSRRRASHLSKGECDLLVPFPGMFCSYIDHYTAPGCEGTLHDLYHAFLVSSCPETIRNYLFDYAEKLCNDECFREAQLQLIRHYIRREADTSSHFLESEANHFKGLVYDMEIFVHILCKLLYPKGARLPILEGSVEKSINDFLNYMGYRLVFEKGVHQYRGAFYAALLHDKNAPWNA